MTFFNTTLLDPQNVILVNDLFGVALRKANAFEVTNSHLTLTVALSASAVMMDKYGAKGKPWRTPLWSSEGLIV
jgi:hypothetical protein